MWQQIPRTIFRVLGRAGQKIKNCLWVQPEDIENHLQKACELVADSNASDREVCRNLRRLNRRIKRLTRRKSQFIDQECRHMVKIYTLQLIRSLRQQRPALLKQILR